MARAVRARRMFGGAMRQSGILAAAGLYALDKNLARLAEDHANARILATRLADTPVIIDLVTVQTNIVIFRGPEPLPDAATVVRRAQEQGVLVSAFATRTVRAVTHLNVDAAQCRRAAEVLAAAVAALSDYRASDVSPGFLHHLSVGGRCVTHIVRLLGLEFADLDAEAAADWLARRGATEPFGYVTTPNADHLVRLSQRPDLMPLYHGAMLRLLDSRVVARMARLAGLVTPRVAPGSDLTALLLSRHVEPGEQVTIVGLAAHLLPALVARCGIAAPAHYDPPHGFEHDLVAMQVAVDFVLAHSARFVFLAVGSPRQEMLAAAIRATGRATGVGLCVGASLEFIAGAQRRAPVWMQRAGFEWLHRLGHDPRRLARRYLIDSPAIVPLLLRERRSMAAGCD